MQIIRTLLPKLILASGSIARRSLLEQLGVDIQVYITDCDESHSFEDPSETVSSLAMRKLASYQALHPHYHLPVLACDTLISFEGKLIGKPSNRQEAFDQLSSFSAKAQEVHSGWALWYENNILMGADKALVHFKKLDKPAIEAYLETEQWKGAAGSYRIQGSARSLIDHIQGDEATVIGLPLLQISEILSALMQD